MKRLRDVEHDSVANEAPAGPSELEGLSRTFCDGFGFSKDRVGSFSEGNFVANVLVTNFECLYFCTMFKKK